VSGRTAGGKQHCTLGCGALRLPARTGGSAHSAKPPPRPDFLASGSGSFIMLRSQAPSGFAGDWRPAAGGPAVATGGTDRPPAGHDRSAGCATVCGRDWALERLSCDDAEEAERDEPLSPGVGDGVTVSRPRSSSRSYVG